MNTTTCCGQPTTHKEYNGLSFKATWDICQVCQKEYNRKADYGKVSA